VSPLRIALLDQTGGRYSRELEAALNKFGHDARLVGDRTVPAVETLLRRRGFTPALSHVPPTVFGLVRGEFDLAHAFSAPDAVAAFAWRRVSGCPVVFTCTEIPDRATVAHGRLRLATFRRAVEESQGVVAASEEIRAAVERWFACTPPVIAAGDAAAYARLYGTA
jgi:hypothetical protein